MVKVSVVVVTYNHSAYIEQALRSVFEQQTDFPTEVIISEDASTDGTREIVQAWRDRYPDRTRLILSERNVRSNEVVRRGFHAAGGEYVALLDGDDYWSSPHKLARQAAVLDADPGLSICFHNARVDGAPTAFDGLWTNPAQRRRIGLADLWDGNPFATCGSLFRRAAVPDIPAWYQGFFPITDWPLYVLFAEHGDIAFLPDAWGVYRLHAGGLYSSQTELAKLASMDTLYRRMNDALQKRHDGPLRRGHFNYFTGMAEAHLQAGRTEEARTAIALARGYGGHGSVVRQIGLARLALRARFAAPAGTA
jgi:glycosyltransferase involved in cell wall biosynthesis